MSTHEPDQICATLVQKLTSGQSLNATEKAHLSQCAECMGEVVLQLDRRAEEGLPAHGVSENSMETAPAPASPEVLQALEQGRRIFAREFGL